jgi:hypothetical protein
VGRLPWCDTCSCIVLRPLSPLHCPSSPFPRSVSFAVFSEFPCVLFHSDGMTPSVPPPLFLLQPHVGTCSSVSCVHRTLLEIGLGLRYRCSIPQPHPQNTRVPIFPPPGKLLLLPTFYILAFLLGMECPLRFWFAFLQWLVFLCAHWPFYIFIGKMFI